MDEEQPQAPAPVKSVKRRKYCAEPNCGRRPETNSDRCVYHRQRRTRKGRK